MGKRLSGSPLCTPHKLLRKCQSHDTILARQRCAILFIKTIYFFTPYGRCCIFSETAVKNSSTNQFFVRKEENEI